MSITPIIQTFYFLIAVYLMSLNAFVFSGETSSHSLKNQISAQNHTPIKIGLLVPKDIKKDPLSLEAVHAINMVIKKTNDSGGIGGRQVEIITRACDGNWGAGSKQAVNLVYDENVCAIIGSLDGRNAHLAEQVATKAQIVFISTRATDPTLAQINIPWFFRVVPDDIQQAEQLIKEIYQKRKLNRILIISSDSYDDKMAAKTFSDISAKYKHTIADKATYLNSKKNLEDISNKIVKSKYDGIAFFGNGQQLSYLADDLKIKNINIPVFSTLSSITHIAHQDFLTMSSKHNINFICPQKWFDPAGAEFRNQFKSLYNYEPGIIGAYSFDGITSLIQVIESGNMQSDIIRQQLSRLNNPNMLMGPLKINANGNSDRQINVCNTSDDKTIKGL